MPFGSQMMMQQPFSQKKRVEFYLFTLFLLAPFTSRAAEFHNLFNHTSPTPITRFHISGERCTGTNFIKCLVEANFPNLPRTEIYGQKHFLWWFGSPIDREKLKQLGLHEIAATLKGSDNCLFITIVRNPYDWIRSFYKEHYHTDIHIWKGGISHFLRAEWKATDRFTAIDNENPWTKKPFSSVLELRKYKTLNYLKLGQLVSHYCFVRYEDLRDDPEGFVNFLAETYHLTKPESFTPIPGNRGNNIPYRKKEYPPLSPADLKYLDHTLDWHLENKIGYYKK
jgi:hypothetical protein